MLFFQPASAVFPSMASRRSEATRYHSPTTPIKPMSPALPNSSNLRYKTRLRTENIGSTTATPFNGTLQPQVSRLGKCALLRQSAFVKLGNSRSTYLIQHGTSFSFLFFLHARPFSFESISFFVTWLVFCSLNLCVFQWSLARPVLRSLRIIRTGSTPHRHWRNGRLDLLQLLLRSFPLIWRGVRGSNHRCDWLFGLFPPGTYCTVPKLLQFLTCALLFKNRNSFNYAAAPYSIFSFLCSSHSYSSFSCIYSNSFTHHSIVSFSRSPIHLPIPQFTARSIKYISIFPEIQISKCTLTATSESRPPRRILTMPPASSKSTSSLKKIQVSRPRPYPSSGVRVELCANGKSYDIRPRRETPVIPGAGLPPNSEALLGVRLLSFPISLLLFYGKKKTKKLDFKFIKFFFFFRDENELI